MVPGDWSTSAKFGRSWKGLNVSKENGWLPPQHLSGRRKALHAAAACQRLNRLSGRFSKSPTTILLRTQEQVFRSLQPDWRARGHPRGQNDGGGVPPRQPRSQPPPAADPAARPAGEARTYHAAGTPEISPTAPTRSDAGRCRSVL